MSSSVFARHLPPAAGASSPGRILRRLLSGGQQRTPATALTAALEKLYPGCGIVLVESGTVALSLVLRGLASKSSRRTVLVSAYTCPDVVTAVLQAGLRPQLVDVQPDSLAMRTESAEARYGECLAAILSNLYGAPEPLEAWEQISMQHGVVIVDDACQAALSVDEHGRVGARGRSVGVTSFGRGKAFSGVGGGAVIVSERSFLGGWLKNELLEELRRGAPVLSPLRSARDFCYGSALWALSVPRLYGLPASLPFLGLGETHFEPALHRHSLSAVALVHAAARAEQAEEIAANYRRAGEAWCGLVPGEVRNLFGRSPSATPIRYPVLCPSAEVKARVLTRAGSLGVSGSYPRALVDFPDLAAQVSSGAAEHARSLAARILTLPVHRHVRGAERERAANILREEASR